MRYSPIDKGLFIQNRAAFSSQMDAHSVAVFYANDQQPRNGDQYFPFRQQSDLFYLSGIDQEKSVLIIAPDCPNPKLREALFLIRTNEEIAIWEGHKYLKNEAREISGIANIYWLDDMELLMNEVITSCSSIYLNRNEYPKFFPDVAERNHRLGKLLKEKFPIHQYKRSAPILTKLRMLKSETEIQLLQKACDITKAGFERVLAYTKPGKYEFEIQGEIDHEFTKNRANGHGYAPIIATGQNSCVLHYIQNDQLCEEGDLLLMDFGAEYANYTADMSRTIPVNGKFNQRQKDCYNAVLRVFKELKKMYVPGTLSTEINERANKLMEAEMVELGLFTEDNLKNQNPEQPLFKTYFMHGVAHHIGLDVHDVGPKDVPFEPGMVLTCEPGLYIREENIGIRIENDILITEGEPIDLMAHIPIEVEEIEALMAKVS